MTPQMEAAYRADLQKALDAGYQVLESGGASLDADSFAKIVNGAVRS